MRLILLLTRIFEHQFTPNYYVYKYIKGETNSSIRESRAVFLKTEHIIGVYLLDYRNIVAIYRNIFHLYGNNMHI